MIKCYKCGNDDTFYTKDYAYGSIRSHYDSDGSWSDDGSNSDLHSSLNYKHGNTLYCTECDKKVGKVDELGIM